MTKEYTFTEPIRKVAADILEGYQDNPSGFINYYHEFGNKVAYSITRGWDCSADSSCQICDIFEFCDSQDIKVIIRYLKDILKIKRGNNMKYYYTEGIKKVEDAVINAYRDNFYSWINFYHQGNGKVKHTVACSRDTEASWCHSIRELCCDGYNENLDKITYHLKDIIEIKIPNIERRQNEHQTNS